MPTSVRGRSGSSSSAMYGGRSHSSGWGSKDTSSNRSSTQKVKHTGGSNTPPGYKSCQNSFAAKIQSYKMLWNQTKGPASYGRPTTGTLNTFANWINKGAVVQTCTKAQVSRWAKTASKSFNSQTASTASCKNILGSKFGRSTIKAVARTKSGSFMVATTPTCNGKRFCFPK